MEREEFITGAEACQEVIFVGPDGPFSCISPMHGCWGELVLNAQ